MGELKFNAERMNEVLNRLDEIQEQLNSATNAESEKINSIASNITGDTVISTLKSYVETHVEVSNSTIKLLKEMQEYLRGQLTKYTQTEMEAKESLSDVQNILSQLEGGV